MKRYSASRYPSRNTYTPRSVRKFQGKSRNKLIGVIIFIAIASYFLLMWGVPALLGSLSKFNQAKSPNAGQTAAELKLAPPVFNIPIEATNSAALRIRGYGTANSKVDIYLNDVVKDTLNANADGSFITKELTLSPGVNFVYGKTVDEDGHESLSSKPIKLIFSSEKPKLEVSEPEDLREIQGGDKKIKVAGTTDPGNTVWVNDAIVIVNNEGKFATEKPLQDGDNIFVVKAANSVGTLSEIQRKIIYKSTEPSPSPNP